MGRMEKVDETRLNVPMPQSLRDRLEARWRELPGMTGASAYVRSLIEKDLANASEKPTSAGA